jgi:hypothetical protein
MRRVVVDTEEIEKHEVWPEAAKALSGFTESSNSDARTRNGVRELEFIGPLHNDYIYIQG